MTRATLPTFIAACLLASGTAYADDIVVTGFTDSAPGSVPGN